MANMACIWGFFAHSFLFENFLILGAKRIIGFSPPPWTWGGGLNFQKQKVGEQTFLLSGSLMFTYSTIFIYWGLISTKYCQPCLFGHVLVDGYLPIPLLNGLIIVQTSCKWVGLANFPYWDKITDEIYTVCAQSSHRRKNWNEVDSCN